MDAGRLAELTASIRQSGVVQPILVRRRGARYQIIAGERRWRAAREAGLEPVPVHVRDVPDGQLLELAIVENVQREELTALRRRRPSAGCRTSSTSPRRRYARRVGRERSTIANTMRLLRLPRELQGLLAEGRLDAGHARAILALERDEDQLSLGREAARKGLSVREVERRVALLRVLRPGPGERRRDANTGAAEERLRAALGARVEIARRGRSGQIRIRFQTEAELNRLFELLVRRGR